MQDPDRERKKEKEKRLTRCDNLLIRNGRDLEAVKSGPHRFPNQVKPSQTPPRDTPGRANDLGPLAIAHLN